MKDNPWSSATHGLEEQESSTSSASPISSLPHPPTPLTIPDKHRATKSASILAPYSHKPQNPWTPKTEIIKSPESIEKMPTSTESERIEYRTDEEWISFVTQDSIKVEECQESRLFRKATYTINIKETKVVREYSDFEHLHKLLTSQHPYRLCPLMPTKKVYKLRQFLMGIYLHPVLSKNQNFSRFISGQESEKFRKLPIITVNEEEREIEYTQLDYDKAVSTVVAVVPAGIARLTRLLYSIDNMQDRELESLKAQQNMVNSAQFIVTDGLFCLENAELCQSCMEDDRSINMYCRTLEKIIKSKKTIIMMHSALHEGVKLLEQLATQLMQLIKKVRQFEKANVDIIAKRRDSGPGKQQVDALMEAVKQKEKDSNLVRMCVLEEVQYWHSQSRSFKRLFLHYMERLQQSLESEKALADKYLEEYME